MFAPAWSACLSGQMRPRLMTQADQAPGVLLSRLRVEQRNAAVDVERSKKQPDWALSL